MTLGEVPEALKKIEKSLEITKNNNKFFKKKPQANGNTASIKPSEAEDPEEDPNKFMGSNYREEKNIPFGFGCNNLQASTLHLLNEDTIPNWNEMKKTEHQSDKTCVICGKPKMDLLRYQI